MSYPAEKGKTEDNRVSHLSERGKTEDNKVSRLSEKGKTEDSRVRQNESEMIPIITLWCVNENGNELPQRSSNEIITGLRVKRD